MRNRSTSLSGGTRPLASSSLTLDFLSGFANPAVRTTRSTLATQIGPDGTMQWGPHNLVSESGQPSGGAWSTFENTFGTTSASTNGALVKLIPSVVLGAHRLYQSTSFIGEGIFSFDAKASEYSVVVITNSPNAWVYFNLADGTMSSLGTGWVNAGMTLPDSNGVRRCWAKSVNQTWGRVDVGVSSTMSGSGASGPSFSGNAASGVFVGNLMLENVTGTNRTAPSVFYVDSTVKNRLGFSNDFTNAVWVKTGISPQANSCTGPNGQPATTLTATTAYGLLLQTVTGLAGVTTSGMLVRRRLGVGAISLRNSADTAWIPQTVTSEWMFIQNDGGTAVTNSYCYLRMDALGDQIDICDARLVPGTSAANYSYNPGAAPTPGPIYGLRTDYDPVTLACKGALIEPEQRTQLLANPDDLSASPWAGAPACTNDGTKINGRIAWKVAKTTASTLESRNQTTAASYTGNHTTRFSLLAGNSTQCDFGMLDGGSSFGANIDCSITKQSGPGTITQNGGTSITVTGLATNVPTVIYVTRNYLTSAPVRPVFYPDTAASTTIGKYVYIQVDNLEAGTSPTSFIPNPSTSGTVVRAADTAQINYDDLAKALPWLMDTNIIPAANVESFDTWNKVNAGTGVLPVVTANDSTYAAPDGTFTADKVVFNAGVGTSAGDSSVLSISGLPTTTAATYTGSFRVMGTAGTQLVFRHVSGSGYGVVTCTGLGTWDIVPGRIETAFGASSDVSIGIRQGVVGTLNATATVWLWGAKVNPGPVAQTYYPQSVKQGTIVVEADLTYGATGGAVGIMALENGATSNRIEIFKNAASNTLVGYVNANNASPGSLTSGTVFKAAIGFSPSSAGVALNGSAETAITPSAFTAMPNRLSIGTDGIGYSASSMHLRRLRIFGPHLPTTQKQAITRIT